MDMHNAVAAVTFDFVPTEVMAWLTLAFTVILGIALIWWGWSQILFADGLRELGESAALLEQKRAKLRESLAEERSIRQAGR